MKSAKNYVRDNVPLSRFGVLVAQLESIVASAAQQPPDPLLCFDLLSDLISAIDDEPKESILLWQRKCEDALYSLLVLGARRQVRHLASVAMARIIYKGDAISIYSRASSLQGFLSDGKKSEPQRVAGAAQCLGELYRYFGRRITSGLLETTIIATKLMKFNEEFVRKEALLLLQKALEGSGGSGASSAYSEAYRLVTRSGASDKSFIVRIAAANCLKAFASIGGPGLGVGELDHSASLCVKTLEDPLSSVRDAFAEALGSLLALGMNPEAQVQPRGKGPFPPAKKLEGGLQRHLTLPFVKASGIRMKDLRVGITLSWVFFLQAIRVKYLLPDGELQNYAPQIIDMLRADNVVDAHSLACILYILRVGVTDQMTEPTQRGFLVFLGKQLESPDLGPSMRIAVFRTLSYTLKTLGEVPLEFKEVCDDTVVAAVSHHSQLVRIEAALTLQVLAEVDPTCVGGLISYTVTTLSASRESVSFEKGSNLKVQLDTLHGQATVLAALVYISPKLPLGYPARLPMSILEVSKRMLEESSRNPLAATVEKEAGWLLLSSLLSSMPMQELEDQVFDILSLWASLFSGNPQHELNHSGDLTSSIRVWSAAIEALAAFVRCFVAQGGPNNGILLQPVMVYLSSALEYITLLQGNHVPHIKQEVDVFTIRTLRAYQSLPEPMAYKTDHPKIIQLCTNPFRDASRCEESSCLRLLLDKRDAWLGPWTPGRDWLEDELRAFQGGKDGIMPCVWDREASSFPQPETINKMLVNQMLLCFGIMFASQDSSGMLFLLGTIEQSLKASKKQTCHGANVTNMCVGLLAGLKALVASRPQPLGSDILNSALIIFQNILAEGGICASHRRAASEGLGLLAKLGNDIFTARMMRLLLNDLSTTTDSSYAGSIAFALGCIHCSAGGMALSTLVPATVNSVTMLAKSTATGLQLWSLHGLLLTIEAAGFSYVSHVQATLGLAVDILLSEENGLVELQQGVGRLINAIVAVLGPELAPGSIFFSRCKSVIAEISSQQETATLLESVRFTQHLVLFAPQAVSVHSHVQTLLSTLSSRQPTLRHLAISTLRHLIEKDPDHIINEQIEENLFHVLDEETDSEIGNLVRAAIMRLLLASSPSCPSHWILTCRDLILATAGRRAAETSTKSENDSTRGSENDSRLDFGEDDQNMVSGSKGATAGELVYEASSINSTRDKHLRYRTRVFAAESLSHLPLAVGNDPAHFDLSLARKTDRKITADWLVLHLQELISLAYQISTIQFEKMRPIGVGLLCAIVDKFERSLDPDLPGHLLLEQYQAQLVSAVRTALDSSSGPVLLEAGLLLATKIMTGGILGSDQAAIKRIFALISRPLNDFKDIYYPSFAEWVSCKIKIRLLAAHASLKCYTYAFLQRHQSDVPHEYLSLLPLFAKSSSVLGKYWIGVLKDYCCICLFLNIKTDWNPFLDGIQSLLVSLKLKPILEETWPVILQALALDAIPAAAVENSKSDMEDAGRDGLISGYSMVRLDLEEYQCLWGFALLVLFQQQNSSHGRLILPLSLSKAKCGGEAKLEDSDSPDLRLHEIVLPVFQFLSGERFFRADFLSVGLCLEFLQVLTCSIYMDDSWNSLAISVLTQIIQNCPEDFLETEQFAYLAMELPFSYMLDVFFSHKASSLEHDNMDNLISQPFAAAKALISRFDPKVQKQMKSMIIALLLLGYNSIREASTELCYSKVVDFLKSVNLFLSKLIKENGRDGYLDFRVVLGACMNVISDLTKDCIKGTQLLQYERSDIRKLLQLKLSFSLEETIALAKLGYLIECSGEHRDVKSYPLFKHCADNIHASLNHTNLQVQAIGLQVLKTAVQRSSGVEDCTFLLFFIGELLEDILTITRNMLKKPMGKESVAIVGECLRFLMLLQTLSKSSDCQRAFMDLLLKAILMVLSATENDGSQQATDVKAIAVRLVSHLAQIPSSAVHFKDVLLLMTSTHRQQLQGLILSTVAQDRNVAHIKPTIPLEIKLPVSRNSQAGAMAEPTLRGSEEKSLASSAATTYSDVGNVDEDEEEEEDWDTFQSFHASTGAIESGLTEEGDTEERPKIETQVSAVSDLTLSVNAIDGSNSLYGSNSEEHVESVSYTETEGYEDNVEAPHSTHARDIFYEPVAGEQERKELDTESAIIDDIESEGSSQGLERELHESTKDPLDHQHDHLSDSSATSEETPEIQTVVSAIDDRTLSAEGVDSSNNEEYLIAQDKSIEENMNKLEGSPSSCDVLEIKEPDSEPTNKIEGEANEEQTVRAIHTELEAEGLIQGCEGEQHESAKDHLDQAHYLSTSSAISTVNDSLDAGNILPDTHMEAVKEEDRVDKNKVESEQNDDLHQKNGNEPKSPQVEEGKRIDAEVYGEVDMDAEETAAAHKTSISLQDDNVDITVAACLSLESSESDSHGEFDAV